MLIGNSLALKPVSRNQHGWGVQDYEMMGKNYEKIHHNNITFNI